MANPKFPEFVRSTEFRRELGLKRKKAIRKMYSDIAKETENKINAIQRAGKWTGTTVLQMKQLRDLQKSIDDSLKNITAQIEKDIVSDMKKVAEVTCADVAGMMKRIGLNVGAAYAHVPELAVKNIVSGNLYGQRWNFSTAVWGDYRKASGDLAQIVAKGLAQNRPIYDIAKDLEKYVNPNVRKDFDWSRRYPGSKKTVDYNAYRLAQTMSTHAHQQAVIIANRDNPLFDGVEWHSSGNSRTCPLCEQRDGEIFPFDKCPMDHPMGQCTLSPHMKPDSRTAAERIGDWIGGKSEDPELDKFAETLGYTDKSQMAVKTTQSAQQGLTSVGNGGIIINNGSIHIPTAVNRNIVSVDDVVSEVTAEYSKIEKIAEKYKGIVAPKSEFTYAISEYTGFNGLPQTVSENEFDLISSIQLPLYRGISTTATKSAAEMANDFKTGPVYFGKNAYGSGIYFSPESTVAKNYAGNNGTVVSVVLSDDVKYITYTELNSIAMNLFVDSRYKNNPKLQSVMGSKAKIDYGRLATLLGYDAIKLDGFNNNHHIILLNRTKAIVRK